jgi:hypothetical protein
LIFCECKGSHHLSPVHFVFWIWIVRTMVVTMVVIIVSLPELTMMFKHHCPHTACHFENLHCGCLHKTFFTCAPHLHDCCAIWFIQLLPTSSLEVPVRLTVSPCCLPQWHLPLPWWSRNQQINPKNRKWRML